MSFIHFLTITLTMTMMIQLSEGLYYPSNPDIPTMEELKKEYRLEFDLKDLEYQTKDNEHVHIYYGLHPLSSKMILLFQSNAGCFLERLPILNAFYKHFGISVGILSYRGYGKSTGTPSEQGFIEDAVSGIHALNTLGIATEDIIVIGRSIGVGVAINTALHCPLKKLILENGFTSLKEFLPNANWGELIVRDPWKNQEKLTLLEKDVKVLFLISEDDEIVPPWMSKKMEETTRLNGLKTYSKSFPHAKHMNLPRFKEYYDEIKRFIDM